MMKATYRHVRAIVSLLKEPKWVTGATPWRFDVAAHADPGVSVFSWLWTTERPRLDQTGSPMNNPALRGSRGRGCIPNTHPPAFMIRVHALGDTTNRLAGGCQEPWHGILHQKIQAKAVGDRHQRKEIFAMREVC